ncbi:MAG: hypothetical protein JO225_12080 [Candidatus Eremiobacteraeota bacterium]|nr:hypothetical protein [Candidatus Eremiobacteraeota bacterium]
MPNNDVSIRINLGDWGNSLKELEARLAAGDTADSADAPYYCGTNS